MISSSYICLDAKKATAARRQVSNGSRPSWPTVTPTLSDPTRIARGAGRLDGSYVSYDLGNFFSYHGRETQTTILQLTVTGDQRDDTVHD